MCTRADSKGRPDASGRPFFVCAGGWLRGWIKRQKRTIRTLGWRFNADRMAMGYIGEMLCPGRGSHLKRQARNCVISFRPIVISVLTPELVEKLGSFQKSSADVMLLAEG